MGQAWAKRGTKRRVFILSQRGTRLFDRSESHRVVARLVVIGAAHGLNNHVNTQVISERAGENKRLIRNKARERKQTVLVTR